MAIVRNQLALKMRGRVGAFSYYTESGRQIVRQAQNTTNYGETARRTESQQMRRAKWGNLVNFYKISKDWMPHAYETKKANQSDYNKFMSLNTDIVSCYLQKGQIAVGGCVVEPYIISEGSIRTIDVHKQGDVWRTDIAIGSLVISDNTTVAEFTAAILEKNPHIREGYQLSFISYQQDELPNQLPQVLCAAYEVTLNLEDNSYLREFLPEFCSRSLDGFVSTGDDISLGAFAYIWSTSVGGKTKVSTQTLINNNESMIEKYTTFQAYNASIQSYGLDDDTFLMSGSNKVQASMQPQFIPFVSADGRVVKSGEWFGRVNEAFTDGKLVITFANSNIAQVSSIGLVMHFSDQEFQVTSGITKNWATVSVTHTAVAVALGENVSGKLRRVIVHTASGDYDISFDTEHEELG